MTENLSMQGPVNLCFMKSSQVILVYNQVWEPAETPFHGQSLLQNRED